MLAGAALEKHVRLPWLRGQVDSPQHFIVSARAIRGAKQPSTDGTSKLTRMVTAEILRLSIPQQLYETREVVVKRIPPIGEWRAYEMLTTALCVPNF